MVLPNSEAAPLRVAIIGSGPSGFYAADALLQQKMPLRVDMFDRLPTPHGLVRGGVAPDHDKIKSVTKVYDKIAENPKFRFYGNVEFGKDILHDEFKSYYHAIIYATGAQTDRHMGIPGEDLAGSHPATEFVAWYNAHPDYSNLSFDLSQEAAIVVGNGNVAMDVVRILASSYNELCATDIAGYALEALRNSKVKDIYMLGRRGPAQASFTNPELKEFGEMAEADVIVSPDDLVLDPLTREALAKNPDSGIDKNLRLLGEYSKRPLSGKPKRIHMRFLVSPAEILGNGHVEQVMLVRNVLQAAPDGSLKAKPTDQHEGIKAGLIFRSIGYKGVPLLDVPFDPKAAVIPNQAGRVMDPATEKPVLGEYVVGWIKRGPSGIIGTNKPDSRETVEKLVEDAAFFPELDPAKATPEAAEQFIRSHQPACVSYRDWLVIDQIEREKGEAEGRSRVKFAHVGEMLDALKAAKANR